MYGQDNDQDDQDVQRALAQYAQAQQRGGMQPAGTLNPQQQGMQVAPQSPMMQRPPQQPMPAQAYGVAQPNPAQSQAGMAAAMQAAQRIGAGAPMGAMGGPAGAASAMGAAMAPRPPMPPQAAQPQPGMGPATMGRAAPQGVASAAPVAAGAKTAGAAAAGIPIAAVVAQYLDKQRQNALMAQQQRASIMGQQAAANGAPMYGVQAAQTRQAMDRNEGQDYLSQLLSRRLG